MPHHIKHNYLNFEREAIKAGFKLFWTDDHKAEVTRGKYFKVNISLAGNDTAVYFHILKATHGPAMIHGEDRAVNFLKKLFQAKQKLEKETKSLYRKFSE